MFSDPNIPARLPSTFRIIECNDPMVDLSDYPFLREPDYFNKGWAKTPDMFIRKTIADKLLALQKTVLPRGFTFKIFDPWRPRVVQDALYRHVFAEMKTKYPHETTDQWHKRARVFASYPRNADKIPPHATGGAIDLTVCDQNGHDLDMGTHFDFFGPEAAPFYFDERKEFAHISRNRKMMREAMTSAGFTIETDEWWHYDFGNQRWARATDADHAVFGEVFSCIKTPAGVRTEMSGSFDPANPDDVARHIEKATPYIPVVKID